MLVELGMFFWGFEVWIELLSDENIIKGIELGNYVIYVE